MIERWNKVVSPSARVIHLGDFGDYEAAKYLNGNITLMYGNYERKDHEGLEKKPIDWLKEYNVKVVDPTVSAMQVKGFEEDPDLKLVLGHEPLNVKKFLDTRDADQGSWCLFGHIHARQRVKKFGVDVGLSDHSMGIEIPIAAVAMGATIIEKHFTLDRTMRGPDHKASLEPEEFRQLVKSIRNIEIAKGSYEIPLPAKHLSFSLPSGNKPIDNPLPCDTLSVTLPFSPIRTYCPRIIIDPFKLSDIILIVFTDEGLKMLIVGCCLITS